MGRSSFTRSPRWCGFGRGSGTNRRCNRAEFSKSNEAADRDAEATGNTLSLPGDRTPPAGEHKREELTMPRGFLMSKWMLTGCLLVCMALGYGRPARADDAAPAAAAPVTVDVFSYEK